MPTITRWLVKTSLVMLVAGLALGVYLYLPGASVGGLFPLYLHLLTFGWLTQLIIGIALWMLPKYTLERPRGDERLNWLIYLCLNLGLVLRALFEPLPPTALPPWRGLGLVAAALLQWLAGMLFILQAWPRVKGR
jgi:hypothetical protein